MEKYDDFINIINLLCTSIFLILKHNENSLKVRYLYIMTKLNENPDMEQGINKFYGVSDGCLPYESRGHNLKTRQNSLCGVQTSLNLL